ncbi:cyclin-like protein interacting with PHO85 [Vanrija albida]|uniref:Cyclin-like protein interacting with PHO85 n=1 Tax=Vanrija albida TaxID=181172 RepID=A0ABR3Q590_9TREE
MSSAPRAELAADIAVAATGVFTAASPSLQAAAAAANGADAGPSRPRPSPSAGYRSAFERRPSGEGESGSRTPRQRNHSPDTTLDRRASPPREVTPHLDLASYPTPTLLRLLAALLQQIATANDQLRAEQEDEKEGEDKSAAGEAPPQPQATHEHDEISSTATAGTGSAASRSSIAHPSPTTALFHDEPPPDLAAGDRLFTASKVSLSHPSSILSFHARHVPSISIEAYLLRILKYCPTTNEVFLGLLVYFDRMSKLGTPSGVGGTSAAVGPRGFAIDSYNVHRLLIAGVTVASKFFSDVFYTNSRYAKVGGLPPHELNQLELQFLLLNNFTLMIPPEEMQRYGDRLLAYWQGREHEAGVDSILPGDEHRARQAEREHREKERERERVRHRSKERRESERQSTHTPMDVDEAVPRARDSAASTNSAPAQPSSTAPTTPAPSTHNQLHRSASVPRRPAGEQPPPQQQQQQPAAVATATAARGRPGVSFAPQPKHSVAGLAHERGATVPSSSASSMLRGWAHGGDGGVVGVEQ